MMTMNVQMRRTGGYGRATKALCAQIIGRTS